MRFAQIGSIGMGLKVNLIGRITECRRLSAAEHALRFRQAVVGDLAVARDHAERLSAAHELPAGRDHAFHFRLTLRGLRTRDLVRVHGPGATVRRHLLREGLRGASGEGEC